MEAARPPRGGRICRSPPGPICTSMGRSTETPENRPPAQTNCGHWLGNKEQPITINNIARYRSQTALSDVFSAFWGKDIDVSGFLYALASRFVGSLLKKMGSTPNFGLCKMFDVCLEGVGRIPLASHGLHYTKLHECNTTSH